MLLTDMQAFKLLVDAFIMGWVDPLLNKNAIARQGTFHQHLLTRVIQFYVKDLSRFEQSNLYYSFVSNLSWKVFFNVRAFIQAYNVIELSSWQDWSSPRGLWFTSPFRSSNHDIVIFYVPNFAMFGTQPYFYAEYMATFHSLLLLQGFNSPAIFVMEFTESSKTLSFSDNMAKLVESWNLICSQNPDSKLIIMGDSLGATLLLQFLLQQIENSPSNTLVTVPFAAIVISPILDFGADGLADASSSGDILTANDILKLKIDKTNNLSTFELDTWSQVVPRGGLLLIWGDHECQAPFIDSLSMALLATNRVKVLKGTNKGHCWPFVSFLTEDTQDEKEDSCFIIAGIISRMILFQTSLYKDPHSIVEPMNLLTIDDDHL